MHPWHDILFRIATFERGIEVAPWFKPMIPREGREVVVLDVFDGPALRARAEHVPGLDKSLIGLIDDVDLVGSACEIAELAQARFGTDTSFGFVMSSHNLEHLPDPIRFLRGCESLLIPGGMIAMAVPDKRACFDFFRAPSNTGEMLQAFHERRERPTDAQVFNYLSSLAYKPSPPAPDSSPSGDASPRYDGTWGIDDNPDQILPLGDLRQAYDLWSRRHETHDTEYHDAHCWVFTPASLELILTELILLGLLDLEIVLVSQAIGCEFFVHLRKRLRDAPPQTGLVERRQRLSKQLIEELAHVSHLGWETRAMPEKQAEAS